MLHVEYDSYMASVAVKVKTSWLTHGFCLLSLGIENGELELGAHLGLRTADQQQVERQVVFALLIQAFGIHSQTPDGGRRCNSYWVF